MAFGSSTFTVNDVVERVKRQFGDESAVQVTVDDMKRWINDGQREIVNKNPILKTIARTDIVSGQGNYKFTGLNILSIQSMRYSGQPLKYMSFADADEFITSQDPNKNTKGTPTIWYEWSGEVTLYPTPVENLTQGLTLYYTAAPNEVSSLSDVLTIPNTYFTAIVQYVLQQAYELDEDWEASNQKAGQFQNSIAGLSESESSPHTNFYNTLTISPEDM